MLLKVELQIPRNGCALAQAQLQNVRAERRGRLGTVQATSAPGLPRRSARMGAGPPKPPRHDITATTPMSGWSCAPLRWSYTSDVEHEIADGG